MCSARSTSASGGRTPSAGQALEALPLPCPLFTHADALEAAHLQACVDRASVVAHVQRALDLHLRGAGREVGRAPGAHRSGRSGALGRRLGGRLWVRAPRRTRPRLQGRAGSEPGTGRQVCEVRQLLPVCMCHSLGVSQSIEGVRHRCLHGWRCIWLTQCSTAAAGVHGARLTIQCPGRAGPTVSGCQPPHRSLDSCWNPVDAELHGVHAEGAGLTTVVKEALGVPCGRGGAQRSILQRSGGCVQVGLLLGGLLLGQRRLKAQVRQQVPAAAPAQSAPPPCHLCTLLLTGQPCFEAQSPGAPSGSCQQLLHSQHPPATCLRPCRLGPEKARSANAFLRQPLQGEHPPPMQHPHHQGQASAAAGPPG